tara:strand:+ start:2423 stop:2650 length:228 start_codon:yes stop_codon:yes gene_type:complete
MSGVAQWNGAYPGNSAPGYLNPNGVASVRESIPDVFPVPQFWIAEEKKAFFGGINRVEQDSRQGLGSEISVGFPG